MAHKSTTREILQLRKAFDQYDSNNDGIITFEEFKMALETLTLPEEEILQIFESIVSSEHISIMNIAHGYSGNL
jgi:calcium-dependent protein kinase